MQVRRTVLLLTLGDKLSHEDHVAWPGSRVYVQEVNAERCKVASGTTGVQASSPDCGGHPPLGIRVCLEQGSQGGPESLRPSS